MHKVQIDRKHNNDIFASICYFSKTKNFITKTSTTDLLPVKISVNLKGVQFLVGIKLYTTAEVLGNYNSLQRTIQGTRSAFFLIT